jgi:beta-N-acetylhexosaminidase
VIPTSHKSLLYILIFLLLLVSLPSSLPILVKAQETGGDEPDAVVIESILQAMTPNERVGQLFMVSFQGNEVGPGSAMAELIQRYRIGGVYLAAANRNFVNNVTTPAQILNLTNNLQALAQTAPLITSTSTITATPVLTGATVLTATPAATPTVFPNTSQIYTPVPLFIATNHEGDGYPYTQIRGGLIDVPNAMALGATWMPENARLVGEVVGQELALVGVNMLFGPALDVLDNPRPDRGGSLGARTFGAHPFWVAEMGQAYIRGVHQGSKGQVLTIAKHFPGFGSSDRPINQAVPTIPKSLDALQSKELLPFFKVTQLDPNDPNHITDGLMTTHARYQGLQGSLPISLDARNLAIILALKEIAPWREQGGLIVSAPLGVPASLEGLVGATRDSFPARLLAQNAFLAGSDVLFLQDFAFEGEPAETELVNIKNAIGFFQEKYASEPNFQAAIDKAVRRIIKAKLKIYGPPLLETKVQKARDELAALNNITIDLDRIARAGVTLISSATQQRRPLLPGPPQPGEQILIFTDNRLGRDCVQCGEFALIRRTALQEIIVQLFGPNATGQILPEQITSFNFDALKAVLASSESSEEKPSAVMEQLEAQLQAADWLIFVMLDVDPEAYPSSDAVKTLLRNRYDSLRNKKLVVFGFNTPYFFDETEISQLTAYYNFYSKGQTYLETAARLLFQQFEPSGASPVGIPAIGPLDLSPDPAQIIQLEPVYKIDTNGNNIPVESSEEPITSLDLKVGEGILLRTGVILDKNGHPVPDGTLVNFYRYYPLLDLPLAPQSVGTVGGVAKISIIKDRDTPLQVRASSNLATQSVTFNIGPGIVDTPTPTPTFTPFPTDTPTSTTTPTITSTPSATPEPSPTPDLTSLSTLEPPVRPINYMDLVYSMLATLVIGGIAFTLGSERLLLEERLRSALVAVACGLVGYIGYALLVMTPARPSMFEVIVEQGSTGHWVAPLISLLFAIIGTMIWYLKPGRIQAIRQFKSQTEPSSFRAVDKDQPNDSPH